MCGTREAKSRRACLSEFKSLAISGRTGSRKKTEATTGKYWSFMWSPDLVNVLIFISEMTIWPQAALVALLLL